MSSKVKETLSAALDDGWVRITFFAAQDQLGKSSALSSHHSKTYISTGGSSVLVKSSEESELSKDSTASQHCRGHFKHMAWWQKMIQLSKLALHCTCNLHSVCIVLVTGCMTGSDCMNKWWWIDDQWRWRVSQSVQKYTYNKKMLYIVFNQKYSYYTSIMLNASAYLLWWLKIIPAWCA